MTFVIVYQKKRSAKAFGPNAISVLGNPNGYPFEEYDEACDFAANQFGWDRWWDVVEVGSSKNHPEYGEPVFYLTDDLIAALASGQYVVEGEV